ncbi:hypothetical protein [Paenibacillus sp. LHD-38]|uniref:hypothetical protein n=1 Tax=Paenibacillus sp. LHD-38 TaxID=3072143 RepID=UPI0028101C37|nr:hypothetical protein [Paenibacillus sp. LHD-38]MDQ8734338.1 hypothetical protein [Paenibacillus sp. LHD-38]
MKQQIKIGSIIIAMLLFVQSIVIVPTDAIITHAAESESDARKLLSGNTRGVLFPNDTPFIETGAIYVWQQEGLYSTYSELVAADPGEGSKMTDGSVTAVIPTASQSGAAYGTLVYDLQDVYRVSALQVWSEFSVESGLKQVEIYASIDGVNYNRYSK